MNVLSRAILSFRRQNVRARRRYKNFILGGHPILAAFCHGVNRNIIGEYIKRYMIGVVSSYLMIHVFLRHYQHLKLILKNPDSLLIFINDLLRRQIGITPHSMHIIQ